MGPGPSFPLLSLGTGRRAIDVLVAYAQALPVLPDCALKLTTTLVTRESDHLQRSPPWRLRSRWLSARQRSRRSSLFPLVAFKAYTLFF